MAFLSFENRICLPFAWRIQKRGYVRMNWHTLFYWCPVNKRRRRDRPQTGVLTPGTGTSTKLSPERATEYITCLISNCLCFCRPFGTFHVVAQLPGVTTPVCGLSSLRDFRVSPHELLLSRMPNYRYISRGSLDFPRTAIILFKVLGP